ncbi:MAG: glycoside hydrolase family 3 C-terminal domain-containing protein [bacterium]
MPQPGLRPGISVLDATSERRIDDLVAQLTLEEKVSLVGGADAWRTNAVPRLGIPAIKVTDGPHGARGGTFGEKTAASFPCGTALGATWNLDLVREVGAAIGQEARTKDCSVLLAPTLNIHRHPLAGRNFECYSEDPHLVGEIGVAFIQGVQSEGVAATAKHFVANDSEFERMTISSEVGERALREIYLAPFDAAIHDGQAWAGMTAYNRINGTSASENAELISLLKDNWGFDGLLMSDWWGTYSIAAAEAGLDLEMPGRPRFMGRRLLEAINAEEIPASILDDKVRRLLRLAIRTGALDGPGESEERSTDRPEHRDLIRRASIESTVLLKNDDGLLPLQLEPDAIVALIGPHADLLCMMGGGSSAVEPHHVTSLAAALRERMDPEQRVEHEPGVTIHRRTPVLSAGLESDGEPGIVVDYFDGPEFEGRPAVTRRAPRFELRWLANSTPVAGQFSLRAHSTFIASVAGEHRFTLSSAGLSRLLVDGALLVDNWTSQSAGTTFYGAGSAEVGAVLTLEAGSRHEVVLEYQSAARAGILGVTVGCQEPVVPDLFERAIDLARRADVAVVVASLTPEWEAEGSDRRSLSLPGAQDELIRRVSAANPKTVVAINAGSPVSMPWLDDVPTVLQFWYPGQEGGDALAEILTGAAEPSGRLPTTFARRVEDHPSNLTYPGEAGAVSYGEGIFVGYRAFDRTGIEPLFPFGHGLGYTTFAWSNASLSADILHPGDSLGVALDLTNTGSRQGAEVVQVYVRDVKSSLLRPDKELKGFAKVHLDPGETRTVKLTLPPRAFEAWDPRVHAWKAEPGDFEIVIARSAGNPEATLAVQLDD